jgi:hypothetical protein
MMMVIIIIISIDNAEECEIGMMRPVGGGNKERILRCPSIIYLSIHHLTVYVSIYLLPEDNIVKPTKHCLKKGRRKRRWRENGNTTEGVNLFEAVYAHVELST